VVPLPIGIVLEYSSTMVHVYVHVYLYSSTYTLHVRTGVQAAEKEGHLAGVNSWRCRVVDAGEEEEHPLPRLHNAPSELFTLRAPPFIFGSHPADVSEH
jgi:hypothetical protein